MATETHGMNWHAECLMDAGSAKGMPQLCTDWMPNQVFWLLVTLVVLFFILKTIALPRIGAVLAERKGTITNDLAAAEELRQKAIAAERSFNEALATARAEAGKIVAAAKADIQKELDAATARADLEIGAKAAESEKRIAEIREGALAAVEAVAKDTAAELVTALGGTVDAGAVTAAVAARLKG
ncbi:F0F1 ATP synthase subunit B' [Xinfangfangia sp. CPCC 101601]|uniref:ATP synthase subunit b n=1 Tax=Pseudogemmobacter lacusdianii TaxID=3069608 RepID=A0ABU0W0E2_9RHOB|nr:F0F1 ATP synthase subunit B' [Xinfangfangia sp. CPCC 101601]MDQ2067442.1 F0F1 ATP synthase subunit B' [Xinfangfangia sp. CPCC 101601]